MNCHDVEQPCWGIAQLILPNGNPWPGNPVEGPAFWTLPPGYVWQYSEEYGVPPAPPLGTYKLLWKVGMPGELYDRDRFSFTIAAPQ
jgi:hypothetical protein